MVQTEQYQKTGIFSPPSAVLVDYPWQVSGLMSV